MAADVRSIRHTDGTTTLAKAVWHWIVKTVIRRREPIPFRVPRRDWVPFFLQR